jgi:hypothetical protein
MKGVITFQSFMQQIFDEPSLAQKASLIGEAILKAGSIRLRESTWGVKKKGPFRHKGQSWGFIRSQY